MKYKILTDGKRDIAILFPEDFDGNVIVIQEGDFQVKSQGIGFLHQGSVKDENGKPAGRAVKLRCFSGAEDASADEQPIFDLIMKDM